MEARYSLVGSPYTKKPRSRHEVEFTLRCGLLSFFISEYEGPLIGIEVESNERVERSWKNNAVVLNGWKIAFVRSPVLVESGERIVVTTEPAVCMVAFYVMVVSECHQLVTTPEGWTRGWPR